MKKTLIALAVLAVSGAAFAQVTITGKVGFGFGKSASQTDSNANAGSGMQLYDGDVNFTANEDLGGGMRVIASTEVQLRGRSDAAASATVNGSQFRPRNSTISLVTPFGLISGGAIESPSGFFRATSYKDFLNTGFDSANGPWDGKANIDFVRFMAPVGPVQLSLWYTEVGAGAGNAWNSGLSTKITAPVLMANFASGPITAYADYTRFTAQKITGADLAAVAGAAGKAASDSVLRAGGSPGLAAATSAGTVSFVTGTAGAVLDGLNRTRIGGDYNFGVAKVSLGYQMRDHGLADQYAVGLTVPLGAVTVNLTYGARDAQKAVTEYAVAADDERTGTALQVQYNFSKLTLAEVSYETYTGGARLATTKNNERDLSDGYRITLRKYF